MSDILDRLSDYGVVPVVVINRAEDAKPLAKALYDGGLRCAEVTFRTDAAEESIRIMTENFNAGGREFESPHLHHQAHGRIAQVVRARA